MLRFQREYRDTRRKLVISFDIGTTYSGISYSILDPGRVPDIKSVTQFPAQEVIQGSSKIPSVIYYDRGGTPRAFGAEAMVDGIFEQAEEEGWYKTEWFKLHLRPRTLSSSQIEQDIPPLPPRKTAVAIFADFLRYLFQCVSTFIQEKEANGQSLWTSLKGQIDYILSHPNGWEGPQQTLMREAAVLAGLVPDTDEGQKRISLVTEGEASLHFAVRNGFPKAHMDSGEGVCVLDAGGGTIDISTYAKTASGTYEEIAAPQCHFSGSIFVSFAAQRYLRAELEDSPYLDDLDHIIKCFDRTTKHRFRNTDELQFIKFGKVKDNDEAHNIRYGQLKLTGKEVATFFEPSIRCITEAVLEQRRLSRRTFQHIILVGGFSASDYLYKQIAQRLEPKGYVVIRPDSYVSKAVSDGAVSFYLDHFVQTRVAKVTYGTFANILYDKANPEHVERESQSFVSLANEKRLPGAFTVVLPKNSKVSETREFRSSFCQLYKDKSEFATLTSIVWCYRGQLEEPKWKGIDTSNYSQLCTIQINLAHVVRNTKGIKQKGPQGKFYKLHYDLVIFFGLTELTAQIAWMEKGVEKRSPAKIFYDPDTIRA